MNLSGLEALELRAVAAAEKVARQAAERRLAETAHDLRAGLASIIGYAQMLTEGRHDELSAKQVAERIGRLALGLCDVTANLLGQDKQMRRRRRASLRRVLAACTDAIERLCTAKGLRLEVDLPDDEAIACDEGVVTRIALNLLTNAVRYTEHGEIRLSARLDPRSLRLEVRDTGIGIALDEQDRIFEAFYRLPDASRLAPAGTGLGLANVKQLCDRVGGRIEVESTLGAGSTFRVTLPRRRRRRPREERDRQVTLFPEDTPQINTDEG